MKVEERTRIEKKGDGAAYTEDDGATWTQLPSDQKVSMNLWGFTPSYLDECEKRFPKFLDENLPKNPEKCEYLLPVLVSDLIEEGKFGETVALHRTDMVSMPIEEAVRTLHLVDSKSQLIEAAREIGISFGDDTKMF